VTVKRVFLAVLILLFSMSCSGLAAPAFPGLVRVKQPDGTVFFMRNHGDERFNFRTDENGLLIKHDSNTSWWYYAAIRDQEIVATSLRVGIDTPEIDTVFYRQDVLDQIDIEPSVTPDIETQVLRESVKTTGRINVPVILINYSDTELTYSVEDFEEVLFGSFPDLAPLGSMRDYYLEVSYGRLDLQGKVFGWFDAERERAYYASRVNTLVREAVRAADKETDFSGFDNDGNGEVDMVVIIHQGMGQEFSGDPNDIWSHMGYLSPAYVSDDGVTIRRYTIQPERIDWPEPGLEKGEPVQGIATVGVVSHELGHVLGLPDLYDYSLKTWGIGYWGLMGYGCWNYLERPGDSPAHMIAWSKLKLGWVEDLDITPFSGSFFLNSNVESDRVLSYLNKADSREYFLMETRSHEGFDKALPGQGLMIYHVDESKSSNNYSSQFPRRLVRVIEADGKNELDTPVPVEKQPGDGGNNGDPFPGSSMNTVFSDSTQPSGRWYDGSNSGLILENIAFNGVSGAFSKVPGADPSGEIVVLIPKIPMSGKADILIKVLETEGIALLEFTFTLDSALIQDIRVTPTWLEEERKVPEGTESGSILLASAEGSVHSGMGGIFKISVVGLPGDFPVLALAVAAEDQVGESMALLVEDSFCLADINRDGIIDEADLELFRASYGKRRGDADWNEVAVLSDLTNDDTVGSTILDLAVFGIHSSFSN